MKKTTTVFISVSLISVMLFFVGTLIINTDDDNALISDNDNEAYVTEKIIDVPEISQYPMLPTGCEAVSATMVLNYFGVNITAEDFATDWLECSEVFEEVDGELYGPDPNVFFVGNPFEEYSYGCYGSAIASAITKNCTACNAQVITDKNLTELCAQYIDKDIPLVIWVTVGMKESQTAISWYLEDDSYFEWISGEHTMVLVGYNDKYYFLNDPTSGSTVAYKKSIVEARFEALGSQAVYIYLNQATSDAYLT